VFTIPWNAVHVAVESVFTIPWKPCSRSRGIRSYRAASPGAAWRRTKRRKDGKWLASAIHGDVKRGSGILNNRRYIGVVSWGRAE